MTRYSATILGFRCAPEIGRLGLREAVDLIGSRQAAAVLLDVVPPDRLDEWWCDPAFPEPVPHRNLPSAVNTGVAIGPTQRATGRELVSAVIDYLSYGGRYNGKLGSARFVTLLKNELGAGGVRIGEWGELPLASKREFSPKEGTYSIPPHCDAIQFARDPSLWPLADYATDRDQVSVFLNAGDSPQGTELVLWDDRPADIVELDEMMREFHSTGTVARLDGVPSVVVNGRPGQIYVLNTRVVHAVRQCTAQRRTLGAFLVHRDDRWHMFQ
ncbi:hypothetical protein [Burkholderia vietnamiensis]|uniref:hypothetical protein n=1 Tax=Burkholderia vietnamiensis TaxID=60552 RepID=UPI00075F3FCF|nr:hypothetical protein [Burkholderia vietnamiensis]TPQ36391.1 hypothetical protein C2U71_26485 [Burkholderia ubonensis]KVE70453.1 hypothetical protein WI97_04650 [Burkholderia vietnamiensis]MBR7912941.1 hypothetical protein [Burkholderia vietnamiensis]MCA8450139.1 hypothetical protein [Burkholderia vietnamiensis]CAG9205442.1 conserved hypothetical protein [Burkholderia vietnamiensis]